MIPLLLWACVRPAPIAPPLLAPPPALESRVDGWSLLQSDGAFLWTELWGSAARAAADQALAEGAAARAGPTAPPEHADPELARRLLALVDGRSRPRAWTFAPPQPGPRPEPTSAAMVPLSPELIAVEVTARGDQRGLRAWFRTLGDTAPALALTRWSADGDPPTGAIQVPWQAVPPSCADLGEHPARMRSPAIPCPDCAMRCTRLPVDGGRLVASEQVTLDATGAVSGSCVTAAVHFDTGGQRWFTESCRSDHVVDAESAEHLREGLFSAGSGPSLPVAWFDRAGVRWLVVNRFEGPVQTRCLARFPAADEAIQLGACVRGPVGVGGY